MSSGSALSSNSRRRALRMRATHALKYCSLMALQMATISTATHAKRYRCETLCGRCRFSRKWSTSLEGHLVAFFVRAQHPRVAVLVEADSGARLATGVVEHQADVAVFGHRDADTDPRQRVED